MAEKEILDQDTIERLMKSDDTFMYKLSLVKDQIITNLGTYADSLVQIDAGLFTDEDTSQIKEAGGSIMSIISERFNNAGSMDNASGNESVFADDMPSIIIDKFGDDAIAQLISALSDDDYDRGMQVQIGTQAGKGIDGILGGLSGTFLAAMGFKLPGWLASVASKAGAAAPIVALAGGIIWAALDGIRGFFQADQWGTSKISGVLGGILGGLDTGLKGALKGMGKWALIGAGIGSIFPVVGTLLGGIVGGVIGGILGWIGGERIAHAFDAVGSWFYEQWDYITDYWAGVIGNIADWFVTTGHTISEWWGGITDFWAGVITNVADWMVGAGQGVSDWWNGIIDFWADVITDVGDWFGDVKTKIIERFDSIKNWFMEKIKRLDPRTWFKDSEEPEVEMKQYFDRQAELENIRSMTNQPPKIIIPEITQEQKATEEAIKMNNKILMQNAEEQRKQMKEQNLATQAQIDLLEELVNKPISEGGSGGVSMDLGTIREAAFDAAYDHRSGFHAKRRA